MRMKAPIYPGFCEIEEACGYPYPQASILLLIAGLFPAAFRRCPGNREAQGGSVAITLR